MQFINHATVCSWNQEVYDAVKFLKLCRMIEGILQDKDRSVQDYLSGCRLQNKRTTVQMKTFILRKLAQNVRYTWICMASMRITTNPSFTDSLILHVETQECMYLVSLQRTCFISAPWACDHSTRSCWYSLTHWVGWVDAKLWFSLQSKYFVRSFPSHNHPSWLLSAIFQTQITLSHCITQFTVIDR